MSKIAVHDPDKRDSIKYVPGPAQKPIAELPDHQVAVVRNGVRVGRVSRGAGAGVAQRLLGGGDVALGKLEGRDAWIAKPMTGVTTAGLDKAVHDASVRAARGSVSNHPDAPEKRVRPRR